MGNSMFFWNRHSFQATYVINILCKTLLASYNCIMLCSMKDAAFPPQLKHPATGFSLWWKKKIISEILGMEIADIKKKISLCTSFRRVNVKLPLASCLNKERWVSFFCNFMLIIYSAFATMSPLYAQTPQT